jgi:hypothetical protein
MRITSALAQGHPTSFCVLGNTRLESFRSLREFFCVGDPMGDQLAMCSSTVEVKEET